MSLYHTRRRQWLYCQRSLREMLLRASTGDAQEIRAVLKKHQRFMALERRNRRTIDSLNHAIH